MASPAAKHCVVCGRTMTWRKKWERSWDEVRYCSSGCRQRGIRPIDQQLEAAIMQLLHNRASGASICPSDAAKIVGGTEWQTLMEPVRAAARRLVVCGQVVVTQGGRTVDASTAKGPIRIRLS